MKFLSCRDGCFEIRFGKALEVFVDMEQLQKYDMEALKMKVWRMMMLLFHPFGFLFSRVMEHSNGHFFIVPI